MKRLFTPILAGAIVALSVVAIGVGSVALDRNNQVEAAAAQPVNLTAGLCNNVGLTWPAGTPIETVAAAVSPSSAIEAVWAQVIVGDERQFVAWSPIPNAPNDLTATTMPLQAVFLCVTESATLTRPAP